MSRTELTMKRIAAFFLLLACLVCSLAYAFDTFTISDIRIDGLSRIAPGTVFTYLSVEKGDQLTPERAEQAVRALYKTGFFSDVQLARQGDILVVTVKERPQISKIALRARNVRAATRYSIRSSMAIGCARVSTTLGAGIAGSPSTTARTVSKEALPAPITIEARNSIVGTPELFRIAPTSWRLAR